MTELSAPRNVPDTRELPVATARRVLLSLHDVTPAHFARLLRAEALFRELGVNGVTYLLVPEYHGGWRADRDPRFVRWCRDRRPFVVDWCLHGCYHDERHHDRSAACGALHVTEPGQGTGFGAGPRTIGHAAQDWFKRRFLTDGEGEFLNLGEAKSRARIDRGLTISAACLGRCLTGFVAPAWLFPRRLLPVLREAGFIWTEDHRRIYDLRYGRILEAPVITWSSRTQLRRALSVRLARSLRRRWQACPLIRIALHPLDFDHPYLIETIKSTVAAVLEDRILATYDFVNTVPSVTKATKVSNPQRGA